MKKYNVFSLKVVKVSNGSEEYSFICRNITDNMYEEVLTKRKIMVDNVECVTPLWEYYPLFSLKNVKTGKSLLLTKNDILLKYIAINGIKNNKYEEDKDNHKKVKKLFNRKDK